MDSDWDTVNRRWHTFLEVRLCPHCGNTHWWAEVKDFGTHKQRWVYCCADRKTCRGLWGPPRLLHLLDNQNKIKWRLPVREGSRES